MDKQEFISNYIAKDKRLQNHNLPFGIQYFNLLAEVEEEAEKKWKILNSKKNNNFLNCSNCLCTQTCSEKKECFRTWRETTFNISQLREDFNKNDFK